MDWDEFLVDFDEATLDELAAEEFFLTEFGEQTELPDCD